MKQHKEQNGQENNRENAFGSEHERLCAYVLGELDARQTAAMEESLASDAGLRAERDRLQATIGLVTQTCGDVESLPASILETLERAAQPLPSVQGWKARTPMRVAAGLAAIATGVLGGRALMQQNPTPEPQDVASVDGQNDDRLDRNFGRSMELVNTSAKGVAQDAAPLATASGRSGPGAGGGPSLPGAASTAGEKDAKRSNFTASPGGHYTGPGDTAPSAVKFDIASYESPSQRTQESLLRDALGEAGKNASDRANVVQSDSTYHVATGEWRFSKSAPSTGSVKVTSGEDLDGGAFAGFPVIDESGRGFFDDGKSGATVGAVSIDLNGFGAGTGNPSGPGTASVRYAETSAPGGPSAPGPSGPSAPGSAAVPALAGEVRPRLERFELPATVGETRARKAKKGPAPGAGTGGGGDLGLVVRGELDLRTSTAVVGADDFYLGKRIAGSRDARTGYLVSWEDRTHAILNDCIRLQNESPRDMFFRFWGDNAFELSQVDAQSTFGVDVDTASYTLARRYINEGHLPTKAQIRTEEFLNYFKPDLLAPTEGVFGIHTELAPSRFGNDASAPSQRWLLRVGLRGKEIAREDRKALNLTFIVDTSGSMKEDNRLELVKHALRLLVGQLDAADSIAIVGFNTSASLILPMTSAQNRGLIEAALYALNADGGTNAEGGLKFGYEVAAAALTTEAHNRVVFLSDGVANIGQTDQNRLSETVRARRESGIYLNTIGVGMDNHNDTFLEQLANKGDGICNYVDSAKEARRALVDNFTGAFQPIARDVKLQVEFDPTQVYRYRLLGYENRAIADADFRNDKVDAGEMGAGHQVVALYELELTGVQSDKPLAQVNLRWKAPSGAGRDPLEDSATERTQAVLMGTATNWEGSSLGYRRSAIVAQFAEILRRSVHARGDSLDTLIAEAKALDPQLADPDFAEFVGLLGKSRELILKAAPVETDLSNCIDSLRRNRILRAQLQDLQRTENQEVLAELERQNSELEGKIRDLIRAEIEKQPR